MNENLLDKKTVRTVLNYLHNFDPNIFIISLDTSARTANDAAESLKVKTGAIIKSLIFKIFLWSELGSDLWVKTLK